MGGVGKTALAIRAARMSVESGEFPGGCIMIDLHGYDHGQEVAANAALDGLLRAVGLANANIPTELADKERLWRSVLAEKDARGERILIVADNASNSTQLTPLLPGTTSHRVIVTSRNSLADLSGARLIRLGELPVREAVELIHRQLQVADEHDDRTVREPDSAEAIARLCGCLPLALRIVASWLALDRDRPLVDTARELDRRSRMQELKWDASLDVSSVFDLSYRRLSKENAQMFRLMAANPGPEISTAAAAAVAGLRGDVAYRRLLHLYNASLIMPAQSGSKRWRMHDLVHLYAKELLSKAPVEREPALENLRDFYLLRATYAERFLDRSDGKGDTEFFTNRQEALEWLDLEYPNLVSEVQVAYEGGHYRYILELVSVLYCYFDLRKHWGDWVATHQVALACADKLDDQGRRASVLNALGIANQGMGQWDKAASYHLWALDIYRRLGRMDSEARVLNNLGTAYRQLGLWQQSIECHQQSLRLRQEVDDRRGAGITLNNLGAAYEKQGNYRQALIYHERALEVYAIHGSQQDYADAQNRLGIAYHGLSCWRRAVELHEKAIKTYRKFGNNHDKADALNSLAIACQHLGQRDRAIECHLEALAIYQEHGDLQGSAWVLKSIGNTYAAMDRIDDARENWQKALAIFSNLPGADAALRVDELQENLRTTKVDE